MSTVNTITTHALDTSLGKPAAGLPVTLEQLCPDGSYTLLASGTTNEDGRIKDFMAPGAGLVEGIFRMTFDTGTYFRTSQTTGFYPVVQVVFEVKGTGQHYHIPLLISPYGYSTYRGS